MSGKSVGQSVAMVMLALACGVLVSGAVVAQSTSTKDVLERRAAAQKEAQQRADQKNDTYTQFLAAIRENRANDVTAMIKKGLDPELSDPNGEPVLLLAARHGNVDVSEALLRAGAKVDKASVYGDTALMVAALSGHRRVVDLLIKNGAEVNRKGWTPLSYAATGGQDEIVERLLDELADIDARAPNGTTALMMAVRQGKVSTVKLLINHGADVNARNEAGASALDWARRGGNAEIVDSLRQAKAQ
ncbi:MAG: ankyrin repeat domain-containing protein [Burkholderiales bacterium]|nr:ankyrin repeat domain-containing protein [Burkholderiales bacterium]